MQSGVFLLANQLGDAAQMGGRMMGGAAQMGGRMMGGAAQMGGHMMGGGPGFLLGGLVHIVWTALIVLAVLWVVRNWSWISSSLRRSASAIQIGGSAGSVAQTPLEILQTRYAKGEITRDEYESIRRDLAGEAPAAAPAAPAA